jgi:enoyl-[acyl-carrier protein] reductase III
VNESAPRPTGGGVSGAERRSLPPDANRMDDARERPAAVPAGGRLDGRVAVVTGASRGLGRAIALRLAREGADCAITYRRNEDLAHEVAREVERTGRRALVLPLELAEPAEVGLMFERVASAWGRADILVANAAATSFRPILEQRPHNVARTFAISVHSLIAMVQAAAPLMAGPSGRIIVISGVDSQQAMVGHGLLGAAKAAAESLVRALALELGPRGITANAVVPGFVETDSSRYYLERGLGHDFAQSAAQLAAATPVRRNGTVDDVAALVAFLASDEAGFLTGQAIVLDGGLTMTSPLNRLAEEEG